MDITLLKWMFEQKCMNYLAQTFPCQLQSNRSTKCVIAPRCEQSTTLSKGLTASKQAFTLTFSCFWTKNHNAAALFFEKCSECSCI